MIFKKCIGCGAILQDTDKNQMGYTPKLLEASICQRCFRMKHYNELPKIVATNEDYLKVIDEVLKKKALMVFIVDIFSFKTTFNDLMIEKLRDKDVILVVNKVDLLPKSTNLNTVIKWIERECQNKHFKVLAVGLVSAKNGAYIDELIKIIDLARKERDVYFVGCANVGKSSVINALLKRTTSTTTDTIATSIIPGTTLKEIVIPYFLDNRALIDTPGLINEKDVLNQLLPVSYRLIIPNSEIKPLTYQITDGNALFIGGLICLMFKCEKMVSVNVFSANNLYVHRTKTARVDELFEKQLGELLTPPTSEEVKNLKYVTSNLKISGKKTIWFSGFGFIQVTGECEITAKRIMNTEVYVTNAIIGRNS